MRFWQCTAVLVLMATALPALAADDDTSPERKQAELDARIAELIEQLGAPEFAIRDKATRELIEIGLPAFDALQQAQFHQDLEIGLRARHLIGNAQNYARDDDPPEVKSILKAYGQLSEDERKSRLQRLALLEGRKGWLALCRLARYERDERLSKHAALAILMQDPPTPAETEQAQADLQLGAGESRRQAALWLRAYARWLSEPETIVSEWNRLVDDEFALVGEKEKSSPEVITALGRWHAQTLHRLGHADQTKAMVKRLAGILDQGSQIALLDHVGWLAHHEMWPLVIEAYERETQLFEDSETLLYRVAEAQRRLGDEAAVKTAARALAFKTSHEEHLQAALHLTKRGLFDWAEAEYRSIIDTEEIVSQTSVRARQLLSEMLHDQEQDRQAAEVLEPMVATLEKLNTDQFGKLQPNPMRQLLEGMGYDAGSRISRMHYFFALDHLKRGEQAEAEARLNKGAIADPEDADVLIALYRLPGRTEEQQAATRRLIRTATTGFQEQIAEYTRTLAQVQAQLPNSDVEPYRYRVAMAHNQLAWLVGNTEGDYEAAVASSHESLKLRPNQPEYLDTLGRCYYAAGDLHNAIKYQSEALRKDPFSGQMKRQLAMFKRELAKKEQEQRE